MVEPVAELNKAQSIQTPDILEKIRTQLVPSPKTTLEISKKDIRATLKASTLDGVFASVFESATTGVILSNFLLQLGASNVAIGILSAIPMVVNLLQPLGAYIADRTTSRHWYNLWVFGASRLLWLVLVVKIVWGREHTDSQQSDQADSAVAKAKIASPQTVRYHRGHPTKPVRIGQSCQQTSCQGGCQCPWD